MAILAFHDTDTRFHFGLNNYHPARLKRLLSNLKASGYRPVSLDNYISRPDEKTLVGLSFDDGFESFYRFALPLLAELEMTATVFVPFDFVGRTAGWDYTYFLRAVSHMNREQIIEAANCGFEIGSHGCWHIDLSGAPERLVKIELERSKKGLEDMIGRRVRFLSYPFGRFNGTVECLALETGYDRGFSLSSFKKSRHQFTTARFAVYSTDNTYSVLKKVEGGTLGRLEKLKGAVINSYARGTILFNKLRKAQADISG
ncbi:MAG: polysaccharide deacetylase family protein [Candidatus Zixiibacteriota bacterium]|nr:MAG: polysaccharide deacetylase family protein [candidate division Zixibacteria bacterium]